MIRQSPKKTDIFLLAFRCKAATDPRAGIQNPRSRRLRQRGQLDHPVPSQRTLPSRIVQIQQPRRHRLVNRIHPAARRHRLTPRVVLIFDPLPPRQARAGYLIVQHHRGGSQVFEQAFKAGMKEGKPMLHPLMLATSADRLVQGIIRPARTKFDPVILPEPADRRLVEDDLGHGREFDHRQLFQRALRDRIKAARAVQLIAKEV